MIKFSAILEKFGQQGEKTGWTYFRIPSKTAQKINPGVKTVYRVKGKLDEHPIGKVSMMPMGDGDFIIPVNAAMRKATGKKKGDKITVQLEVDDSKIIAPAELLECLADEPEALAYYNSLPQSHRNYFTKWIESAKTDPTRTKRIALVVKTMVRKMNFGDMLREEREEKKMLGR